MSYVAPKSVQSPRGRVDDVQVVYDKGPARSSWSIAKLKWDNQPAVGIRWNGDVDEPGSGTPQSRGKATWFIVPTELAETVLQAARALESEKNDALLSGYRAMAADEQRESEALAWSEALIGDFVEAR